MRRFAVLAACFLSITAAAQIRRDAPSAPGYLTAPAEIKEGWLLHSGDNPSFAQPDHDVSGWRPVTFGPETMSPLGWSWYRLTLDLPASHPPLALLLNVPKGTCEIYIDGERYPGMKIESWLAVTNSQPAVVPLPQTKGPITLALRFYRPDILGDPWGPHISVWIGTAPAIRAAMKEARQSNLLLYLPSLAINVAMLLAGLGMLGLFLARRSSTEYLWLGVFLIAGSCEMAFHGAFQGLLPISLNNFLSDPTVYIGTFAQIEFTYAFIRRAPGRAWRCYEVILLLGIVAPDLLPWLWRSPNLYVVLEGVILLPAAILLPFILFFWFRRGNREAGWLIFPSLLPAVAIATGDIGFAATQLGFLSRALLIDVVSIGPFSLYTTDLADAVFLLAIVIVIFLRFARVSREQARAAAELEAAHRVQSLLLRSVRPEGGRFRIEAVYRPAAEVGGDFFHVTEIAGCTRVVVGDVSGKGLGAAMLVSALIGCLDTIADTDPAAVLRRLNQLLLTRQQGGFATCLCTSIDRDARAIVSNAGHPCLYRNGGEVTLESALPLGLVSEVDYGETSLPLKAGDTLAFVSDGVVEARNAAGELFGFERTAAISSQPAESIAQAAQAFGQEDDITVLTLTFAGA